MRCKDTENLLKLIKDNPDLPIIPLVNGEIVGDDYGYWQGAFDSFTTDEYIVPENGEPIVFKSDGDVFDTLEKYLPAQEFDRLPEDEDECRKIYESLPWTKAIIVFIELPPRDGE